MSVKVDQPRPAPAEEPVISPTANQLAGHLPITDGAALRAALQQADIPTLLMVYTQISGDETLLDPFRPHIKPFMQGGSAGIPEDLKADMRDRLFELLTREAPAAIPIESGRMRRMMDVYTGEHVADEFVPLLLEQAGLAGVQGVDLSARAVPPADFRILVIGAGMSGIALGAKLGEAGYDYEVIEKNEEVGGTWYHTTYPGLAVDTPSHFYSFSFELNADWSHWFSRGYQNQAYLRHCAIKYGVRDRTTFRTEVTSAIWDEDSAMWDVTIRSLDSGKTEKRRVNAVISALGFSNRPQTFDIPGAADFTGVAMHSAQWNHSADLAGKRIGVIGTGASSMQISPQMAKIASHLTVFQRSRHWINPIAILNSKVPDGVRWAMRHIPHYGQWWRLFTYWNASDGLYQNVVIDPDWHMPDQSVSAPNEAMRQYLLAYLDEKLKDRPDLKEKVTPDYPPGAKRLCMDAGWFDMLLQDNVTLETSGIEKIVENGILTRDGELIELDVIVFATGYVLAEMLAPMHVEGRDGVTIRQLWGWDDPRAHRGSTVPGFPNFFMISGPNSVPQHGAGINILSETQTNFIIGCLDLMLSNGGKAIEPKSEAFDEWNARLDDQLQHMIWGHHRVKSYYQNSAGRLWLSCPFRIVDAWHNSRAPVPSEFIIRA
ncbi:4-hydroxyacetophenone monooxygenase [Sphingobium sp. OAS761]|uniref:flavin-containing monooxygenase n=1 Tax=Sphingobium sp. OAS761 TaxID=2817901 RepID=UPI00209FEBC8|nr:NAD(P)/FAD-dependent oxidoreductase [Sphingobium sp. OAS761]MCP1470285.1 4-hydroxyacetophenone monooxygenase [Sphingobium sp. OAS761]